MPEGTDPFDGMNKLDRFIATRTRADLEVLARGAIYAANALGRHWPVGQDYTPDVLERYHELVEDIESHIPVGMPSVREEDRTRWGANWWRDLFGMALLGEDGEELVDKDGIPLPAPATDAADTDVPFSEVLAAADRFRTTQGTARATWTVARADTGETAGWVVPSPEDDGEWVAVLACTQEQHDTGKDWLEEAPDQRRAELYVRREVTRTMFFRGTFAEANEYVKTNTRRGK